MFNSRWKEFSGTEHAEEERRWLNAYASLLVDRDGKYQNKALDLNQTYKPGSHFSITTVLFAMGRI